MTLPQYEKLPAFVLIQRNPARLADRFVLWGVILTVSALGIWIRVYA